MKFTPGALNRTLQRSRRAKPYYFGYLLGTILGFLSFTSLLMLIFSEPSADAAALSMMTGVAISLTILVSCYGVLSRRRFLISLFLVAAWTGIFLPAILYFSNIAFLEDGAVGPVFMLIAGGGQMIPITIYFRRRWSEFS